MSFVKAMVEVDPKKSSNETTNEPRKKHLEEEVMTCYLLLAREFISLNLCY